MIHQIRTSKFSKVIASYLAIQLILTTVQPTSLHALTGGPAQPEFNSFTPIGTSDMVNLSSGDFNYNIPIMDVGGYPLNLAYDSGISMDQEASWVGLGWNLNVGQINRQVRGLPDDFNGDEMIYENDIKNNKTIGMTLYVNGQVIGIEGDNVATEEDESTSVGLNASAGITLQHNNYEGISINPSLGFSIDIANISSVGMNLSGSATDGVTVAPSIGISKEFDKLGKIDVKGLSAGLNFGTVYNSRQGLSSFSINTSLNKVFKEEAEKTGKMVTVGSHNLSSIGGSVSFINQTFTPSKRVPYHNTNFTFDASLGLDYWGIDAEVGLTAFGLQQKILEENKEIIEKAYGYEFTKNATTNDILDFNRENDNTFSKNTLILPTLNYTYDLYSINGQGISGQYRPFKGQSGQVFDQYVYDTGANGELGVEVEGASGFHVGVDLKFTDITSYTGKWDDPISTNYFGNAINTPLDYEETYYKSVGDLNVDSEVSLYSNDLGGEKPIALDIISNPTTLLQYGKKPTNEFRKKDAENTYSALPISGKIVRNLREKRNQAFLKVNNLDAQFDPMIKPNINAKPHHTVGMKVLNADGATYIYGESAYNKKKVETTFAVSDMPNETQLKQGLIDYSMSNGSINISHESRDEYFNRVTTPEYAHTYLLTSVLSSDYEDLTGNGPTDDDLGAYTKFYYEANENSTNFNWRVPFEENMASYNPGQFTRTNDQKGSYIYGEKELKYVSKIETKTHVAIFELAPRNDGYGVIDEHGGLSLSSQMYQLKTIKLYSKPEYEELGNNAEPIKTAYFEYEYTLCQGVPNNPTNTNSVDENEGNFSGDQNGKLTLKSLYFTYRDSKMGKYTPYVFNYDNYNPDYQIKSYDIWGNYKPLFENLVTVSDDSEGNVTEVTLADPSLDACERSNEITAQEFPFVQQDDKPLQDYYAAAWTMSSIDLPSGGTIEINYESDDYQYVQDEKAMQMFKVAGIIRNNASSFNTGQFITEDGRSALYENIGVNPELGEGKYIVVQLPDYEALPSNEDDFIAKYIGDQIDQPIAFKFLLNMTKHNSLFNIENCNYEYVSGYFKIDPNLDFEIWEETEGKFAAIPMAWLDMEGGNNQDVNPISKAGWYYGRTYLNRFVYGVGDNTPENASLQDIISAIESSFGSYFDIFKAPNSPLRNEQFIAKFFEPEKSWIRLLYPGKAKLGGGIRVKEVKMSDNWDVMTNHINEDRYLMQYGQTYKYNLENDGGSSGVATFEPNSSRENPFVKPFYNNDEPGISPKELNYVEKPFGKSFFPAPKVTYSRVEVSNLPRVKPNTDVELKKHATGKVVNVFYTSKNFPTKADYTAIDNNYKSDNEDLANSLLTSTLKIESKTEVVASQGFSVVTNDMNGKIKSQNVFDENGNEISGVDYFYNIDPQTGELNNLLPVIHADGSQTQEYIGTHYDVITDFRENHNLTKTAGLSANTAAFVLGAWPVVLPKGLFNNQKVSTTLRTTTTTKVVHKTGILKEKIARDLGARVSTKNLAWDATSGQVLLTQTINEYDDKYYNFTYPAYWNQEYAGMGHAVKNLGITAWITPTSAIPGSPDIAGDEEGSTAWYTLVSGENIHDYFKEGDEVFIYNDNDESPYNKLWINEIAGSGANSKMILIDKNGNIANPCGNDDAAKKIKVVRSIYRNQQSAAMASVTLMRNPLQDENDYISTDDFEVTVNTTDANNPRIINASAVEYKDFWRDSGDRLVKRYPNDTQLNLQNLVPYPHHYSINPFVHNIKGDWRAIKSYAYLTDRTSANSISEINTRNVGFFSQFKPMYNYNNGNWQKDLTDWTFASEVVMYSPVGAELENKDALNRYSAAQYGYHYTLPTAVASNSRYRDMGFDGFEDHKGNAGNSFNNENDNYHFRFIVPASKGFVSDQEAHTGKYSMRVNAGQSATLGKLLVDAEDVNLMAMDCNSEENEGTPYCSYYDELELPSNGPQTIFYDAIPLNSTPENTSMSFGPDGPGSVNLNVLFNSTNGNGGVTIGITNNGSGDWGYLINLNNATSGSIKFTYEITDQNGDSCTSNFNWIHIIPTN